MPVNFDKCLATKGRKVRTMKMKGKKYRHICILPNGKTELGEVKTLKTKK